MMSPKFDVVTQDKIRGDKSKLLIGFQVGFCGVILRVGIYF